MKGNFYILLLVFFLSSCRENETKLSIVLTGDVILDRGVNDMIRLFGEEKVINSFKKFDTGDFLIINYEGVFTNNGNPQNKLYNFKSDDFYASLLQRGGVTHVSVANNHSYDFGEEGFLNTLQSLRLNDLTPLGDLCEPVIIKKGQYRCAILSASLTSYNDSLCISSVNHLKESISIFRQSDNSVPLILYIHWGLELQSSPLTWQKVLAKELVELGVDVLIGHHPHVVQTIEFIQGKPIFYSIGNFIADAYLPNTDCSYTVELQIKDKIERILIRPLKVERYFPKTINPEDQISFIQKFLAFSENICAHRSGNSWQIKPTSEVNFKEDSDIWLFADKEYLVAIKKLLSGSHLMKLFHNGDVSNALGIHGNLSELHISDINNDGFRDIILGVEKTVNFDPVFKKRINVFTYKNNNLQPLWLGTKFIHDVKNFSIKTIDGENYLSTIEINGEGTNYSAVYKWDEFGFALTELNKVSTHEK